MFEFHSDYRLFRLGFSSYLSSYANLGLANLGLRAETGDGVDDLFSFRNRVTIQAAILPIYPTELALTSLPTMT
jgi:hypothetical protein